MKNVIELRAALNMVLARLESNPVTTAEWQTIANALRGAHAFAHKRHAVYVQLDADAKVAAAVEAAAKPPRGQTTMTVVPLTQRALLRDDFAAAGVDSSMRNVHGRVFTGPKHTVYLARCDADRTYVAGWWVQCGKVQELVRTEKQGIKLAADWAVLGFPSERA